jgi:hypothetical protein
MVLGVFAKSAAREQDENVQVTAWQGDGETYRRFGGGRREACCWQTTTDGRTKIRLSRFEDALCEIGGALHCILHVVRGEFSLIRGCKNVFTQRGFGVFPDTGSKIADP